MYNLPDVDIKLEPSDNEAGDLVTSEHSTLHNEEEDSLLEPMRDSSQNHEQTNSDQSRISSPVVYMETMQTQHWHEALIEFSSMLARQMQATLGQVKTDFLQSGKKFDADFRDHLFYVANNRLMESFDSFLIGLPTELRSPDCPINRSGVNIATSRSSAELSESESIDVPVKRRRLSTYNGNAHPTTPRKATSNQSAFSGQNIVPQRITMSPWNGTFGMANMSPGNRRSSTKEAPQIARSIPFSEIGFNSNGRADNLRNMDNIHLYMGKHELSPGKRGRQNTLGGSMVAIPIMRMTSNALDASMAEPGFGANDGGYQAEQAAPKRIYQRRKTIATKNATEQATRQTPSKQPARRASRSRSVYRDPSVYQCEQCGYSTEVRANFQRHLFTHSDERPFQCEYCDKGYIQKGNLIAHMKKLHSDQPDPPYWDFV